MRSGLDHDEPFFRRYALFLLLFVIASFGAKAVFDSEDLPPLTWLHHVHAVSMLAWFGLFALQPMMIRNRRLDTHRLLGALSPLVVMLFIAVAIPITTLNWARIGDPLIVMANTVNLSFFLLLYAAAIHQRRNPAAHKRLMLYASLMLMGPAAGRIPELFDAAPMMAAPIVLGLQFAPLLHDLAVHRRVHPATGFGIALVVAATVLIIGFSGSAAWIGTLEAVIGPRGSGSG